MPPAKKKAPAAQETLDPPETPVVEPEAVVEPEDAPEKAPAGELEIYAPDARDLVALDSEDAFRAMDRADEEMILAEIQGRGVLGVMVYEFDSFESGRKKKVRGLSYDGVRESVRTLNARGFTKTHVSPQAPLVSEVVEDGEPYYRVMVYAEDHKTGSGNWGTAVEPKRMKLRDDTAKKWRDKGREVGEDNTVWDKFALAKALSKAQRNALEDLIPLELRETIIAQFAKDHERIRRISVGAGAETIAHLPPPLDTEEAEELRKQCRALFREIREIHATKYLLPGQFHQLLIRSEWSLERLGEFREHLQGLLDRAKKEAKEGS